MEDTAGHGPGTAAYLLEESVKPLLRTVLLVALVANLSLNFLVEQEALHIALSVVSGVVLLASAAGLWVLRGPREN
ncbi:hypothetical protein [Streptomyces sp. NBC_00385]|uniref:hypothetical protein n=1 Tax=Streptomyces sp. NBC_00385 TaxID=2975733 RepID=UPI002DD991DA|nr:hypothetical protein [Streptomyces sp. NBC_00385]WRZ04257.1 hypothetical protein OG959_13265 [Streptomyces sp. NBC_00385]